MFRNIKIKGIMKIMARVKTPEENEVRYTAAAKALYGTVKRRPSSRA